MKRLRVDENVEEQSQGAKRLKTCGIDLLSNEVLLQVLAYLEVVDLISVASICKRFAWLSTDSHLWKRLFRDTYLDYRCKVIDEKPRTRERDTRNWKYIYQLKTSWIRGRYSAIELPDLELGRICAIFENRIYTAVGPVLKVVHADGSFYSRHDFQEPILNIASAGPGRICVSMPSRIEVLEVHSGRMSLRHSISTRSKNMACSHDYLVTLSTRNTLCVYSLISSLSPQILTTLQGVGSDPTSLSVRSAKDGVVIAIACATPIGLADFGVSLQELYYNKDGVVTVNRITVAECPYVSRIVKVSYSHPHLIAAQTNNELSYFKVCSSQSRFEISEWTQLTGHTAGVLGFEIHKERAVSIGREGKLRIWELGVDTCAKISKRNFEDAIIGLNEERVFARNGKRCTIYDFAIS